MSPEIHFHRKRNRLEPERYRGKGHFFVTLCCHQRKPRFLEQRLATSFIQSLRDCARREHFLVHAYCVMPDHVHLFLEGESVTCNLARFISKLKQQSGFAFARSAGQQLWQKSFYDHILRNLASPFSVAWYIWLNPVRKKICAQSAQYPFNGSFTEMQAELERGSKWTEWVPPWKQKGSKPPA